MIWYPFIVNKLKTQLNTVYNKSIKLCKVETLSVENVCNLQMLCYNHAYEHGHLPAGNQEVVNSRSKTHCYNTRNKNQPVILKHKSNLYNKSYLVKGCTLWHTLEYELRVCNNKRKFKKVVTKKLLLQQM